MVESQSETTSLYKSMHRIRVVEEVLMAEYHPADEMRCPIHFCVGQEAAPATLGLQLQSEDVIACHYRSHGYYLAKGAPLDAMVAEFYGKATGANAGLGGSMELAHHASKIYSGAIVGGTAGLAVGSAFAQKYLGSDGVTIGVFGDGAMDEGLGYEAINMAVLYQVPVLFLCENNGYAAHTPLGNRAPTTSPADRARAFGIETDVIADSDPVALLGRMRHVVSQVRSQARPFFLEVLTYRFCGHVGPGKDDELSYRPKEEVAARLAADPLHALRKQIARRVSDDVLNRIERENEEEIAAAIKAAKAAPFPAPSLPSESVVAGTFDSVVTQFIDGAVAQFAGAQSEAKLAPY